MQPTQNKTASVKEFMLLRAPEVAKVLNISASLAYKLMESGDIPTVRINSAIRVRSTDLDEYIQRSWTGWKSRSIF